MNRTAGTGLSGGTTGTWNPNNDMMNPPRAEVPPPGGRVGALGTNQSASESGILDSTRIDPLNRKSEAQEWAETTRPAGASAGATWTQTAQSATTTAASAASAAQTAAAQATGAAKFAYGHVAGNQEMKNQGSEQLWGKQ